MIQAFLKSAKAGILLIILSFSISTLKVQAQGAPPNPVYVSLTYIKIFPGKYSAYTGLLKNVTKKIAEYNLKNGNIMGWYANDLLMPSGSSAEYNFLVVVVSSNWKYMFDDTLAGPPMIKKIYPGYGQKDLDSLGNIYSTSRTIVKREVFQGLGKLTIGAPPTQYAMIDYMKTVPGKASAYEKMEMETFMPVHAERKRLGLINDWVFMRKLLPYAANPEYDYVTGNFFNDPNTVLDGKYAEAFKKVHPAVNINNLWTDSNLNRTIVKEDIFKLNSYVDYTGSK
jgi:hypothetical protein